MTGNSLCLSPIESLWSMIKEELSKLSSASFEKTLFQNAQALIGLPLTFSGVNSKMSAIIEFFATNDP